MSAQDGSKPVSRRTFLRVSGAAAVAAGASGSAAAAEGGGGSETVNVVDYAFEGTTEDPLQIKPGTTVTFVWKTDNHNVVVDSQPEGASWEGHETLEDSGFEYEHTFEMKGTYEFYCNPHESLGMVGTIEVTDDPSSGEGGHESILPDSARTLGVAATGGMASVLGLSYVFLRYGGDYGERVE
jgi:plastocyanin